METLNEENKDNLNEEEKNFIEKNKTKIKEFSEKYKEYKKEMKKNNNEKDAGNFLFKHSSGWWVVVLSYCIAICIFLALVYQGVNSWYYYQWATVLGKSRYLWDLHPTWFNEFIHWLLSKDSLELPLNEIIYGLMYANLLYAGVEIGFGSVKAKQAEIGTMTELPFKQRYRMFLLVLMWFLLCLFSTVAKALLGTRGFEYFLGEQYLAFATSFGAWITAERIIKAANLSKGQIDKTNDRLSQEQLNDEVEKFKKSLRDDNQINSQNEEEK